MAKQRKAKPSSATVADPQQKIKRGDWRFRAMCNELGIDVDAAYVGPIDALKKEMRAKIASMKARRSDEQVILNEGATVVLGGRKFEIKALPIKKDLEFRRRCGDIASGLMPFFTENKKTDESAIMQQILPQIFGPLYDDAVSMALELLPAKDRAWIEENATTVEMSAAVKAGLKIAIPFVRNLLTTGMELMQESGLRAV